MRVLILAALLLITSDAWAYCAEPYPPYCPAGTVPVCTDFQPYPLIGKYVCVVVAQ